MRILLVEDDIMLGKATTEGLRISYAVDWFENAEDALLAIETIDYDLFVFDINLPHKSGIELLKELRNKGDNKPVLFLTAKDTQANKIKGLNAGADDYLTKPFDLDELIARCAALIRRSQGNISPDIKHGNIIFNQVAHTIIKDKNTIILSSRELAVFEILITNIGSVISKSKIEEKIYDWDGTNIESNTIEVHISALRKKLGKDLIKTIRGVGYIIEKYVEKKNG